LTRTRQGLFGSRQERARRKSIEVFDESAAEPRTLSLFPEDRCEGLLPDASIVRLRLSQTQLCRPRIERQYRKASRIWLMDRGIPTEEVSPTCVRPIRRCNTWSAPRRGD
jgi:hypothetical protein